MPSQPASLAMSSKPVPLWMRCASSRRAAGVRQTAHHRLHASRQKLRRQDVQQLGGAGGIGVHVAPHVQSLLPGLLQKLQHLRDLLSPAVPAHGLQVGDLQRIRRVRATVSISRTESTTPAPSCRICTVTGTSPPLRGRRASISSSVV